MLKQYSLRHFKGINKLDKFTVKPLTILCGTNCSGKSSFIQSLLLLKQSNKVSGRQPLTLNGEYLGLGTVEDVIFEHNRDNRLSFNLSFNYFYDPYTNEISRVQEFNLNEELEMTINLIYRIGQSGFILNELSLSSPDKNTPFYIFREYEKGILRLTMSDDQEEKHAFCKVIKFDGLIPEIKVLYDLSENTPLETLDIKAWINKLLNETKHALKVCLDSVTYVGPFRNPPQRRYNRLETSASVGTKGEYVATLWSNERDLAILDHYFLDEGSDSYYNVKSMTLYDAVRKWMHLMGFKNLQIQNYQELISLLIETESNFRTLVNIADIGFGFSQIFPIIVQGLFMPVGHTLLLEQPEIHLHPALQMKLGDFLLALILSGKQIIVETHSEHIINRITRRIIEDETEELERRVEISFFSRNSLGINIESIIVDDIFGVKNWPDDFFDQAVDEKERILLLSLKKRRAQKEQ